MARVRVGGGGVQPLFRRDASDDLAHDQIDLLGQGDLCREAFDDLNDLGPARSPHCRARTRGGIRIDLDRVHLTRTCLRGEQRQHRVRPGADVEDRQRPSWSLAEACCDGPGVERRAALVVAHRRVRLLGEADERLLLVAVQCAPRARGTGCRQRSESGRRCKGRSSSSVGNRSKEGHCVGHRRQARMLRSRAGQPATHHD